MRPALALLIVLGSPASPVLTGCDRLGDGETRIVRLRGLPLCARGISYARPLAIRLDREPSFFEERFTTSAIAEGAQATATLTVPRKRMKAMLRVGFCSPTSVATWDCAAASWQSTQTLTLDSRADMVDVEVAQFQVPCADGTLAHKIRPR